ncbi:MAG: WG repeat-containing protein [Clostridiales bacterium]|nr:WG repeat-containing protein [Clostridiales bacterium]
MKNNKLLAIIGLIFLNVVAGYLVISVAISGASKFEKTVKKAQDYCDQKLYQKSIEEYDKALAIKDSPEICVKQIEVYDKGIEYGEFTNSYDMQISVDNMVEKYYKNAKVYEAACNLCMKYENYEACVRYVKQAKSQKVKTDALNKIYEEIRYVYQNEYTMYENVSTEINGDYLVETNGMVSVIDAKGESVVPGKYLWATHFSPEMKVGKTSVKYAIVSKYDNESKQINYIVDNTGKKEIYIDGQINGAYAISEVKEGNVSKYIFPCHIGNQHFYYSFDPVTEQVKQISGPYLFAGAYRNGLAAVKIAENNWQIIDGSGKPVDKDFTDVVLNEAAECSPKGLIIAAKNGKYQIYKLNKSGKPEVVKDFSCDGAKAFVDGTYAAYKSGDKWGFVDSAGKVLIDPKYQDARSFSQGMAAVSVNGLWKFINTSDNVVIDSTKVDESTDSGATGFTNVKDFSASGKCFVEDGGYWTSLQLYYVEDSNNKKG